MTLHARTARNYRTDGKPMGVRTLRECERRALEMQRTGSTLDQLAAHFGQKKATVASWLTKAREMERDGE